MEQQYDVLYKVVLVGDPSVGKTNLLATFLASLDDAADNSGDGESNKQVTNPDGTAKGFSSVRKPTIGVEFGTKVVQHPNGKRIKAQIWDTAGQERYRAITSSYESYSLWNHGRGCCITLTILEAFDPDPVHYRRAAGALVVYDVTNPASFEHAQQHWIKELKAHADISSTLTKCITLVGNKVDLEPAAVSDSAASAVSPTATASVPSLTKGFVTEELHDTAVLQLGLIGQRASAKTGHHVRKAFEDLLVAIYDEDKGKFQRIERAATIHLEEQRAGGASGGAVGALKRDPAKCCT